jgi:excisionase family DNA binding protein
MKRAAIVSLARETREWVTPNELSAYLGCDVRTILRLVNADTLYAYRVGNRWRIPTEDARRAFPEKPQARAAS